MVTPVVSELGSECIVSDHGRFGTFSFSHGLRIVDSSERDEVRRNPDMAIANRIGRAHRLMAEGKTDEAMELLERAREIYETAKALSSR